MKTDTRPEKRSELKYNSLSFGYALNGLYVFFTSEVKAVFHICLAILVILAGIFLKISPSEWIFLTFAIGLVIVSEIINTAIERLVNLVSPQKNKQAGIIKDIGAAGVLFAAFISVVIGLLIFVPAIIRVI